MNKKSYYEKLKDPRWQKIRLIVFNRENFKCEHCRRSDVTLSVHHGYYDKDLEPWEYETNTLHCLCLECHEYIRDLTKRIQYEISKIGIIDLENYVYYKVCGFKKEIEKEEKQIEEWLRTHN